MKKSILYTLLVLGLFQAYARAEEPAAQNQGGTISEAVEREMPVLKGDTWMVMDENAKIAFIWGVGHVVTIEQVIMERYPDQKRDTFVMKVVEASNASPATMTQVAAATKALERVALGLLDDHLSHCVAEAAAEGGEVSAEKLKEASAAIARLVR